MINMIFSLARFKVDNENNFQFKGLLGGGGAGGVWLG